MTRQPQQRGDITKVGQHGNCKAILIKLAFTVLLPGIHRPNAGRRHTHIVQLHWQLIVVGTQSIVRSTIYRLKNPRLVEASVPHVPFAVGYRQIRNKSQLDWVFAWHMELIGQTHAGRV